MRILLAAVLLVAGCSYGETRADAPTTPDPCTTRGPWSTWPDADWVRAIVERGGYDVVAETGSALVASGKEHEFYIWAAEGRGSGMPNWRRLATVRGVPIYGDRDLWRSWRAQGFTFWVQGAGATPAAGRLAPVVDASLRLPFSDPCEA